MAKWAGSLWWETPALPGNPIARTSAICWFGGVGCVVGSVLSWKKLGFWKRLVIYTLHFLYQFNIILSFHPQSTDSWTTSSKDSHGRWLRVTSRNDNQHPTLHPSLDGCLLREGDFSHLPFILNNLHIWAKVYGSSIQLRCILLFTETKQSLFYGVPWPKHRGFPRICQSLAGEVAEHFSAL